MQIITESKRWSESLASIGCYDFYHTHHYHRLNCHSPDDRPVLFSYQFDRGCLALPLIIRNIYDDSESASGLTDATSVYGYAGPVSSSHDLSEATRLHFVDSLVAELRAMRVVAVFSRLHPLLRNDWILRGLGQISEIGGTVEIDLTMSEEEQLSQYSSNHKRGIRNLHATGVTCERSTCGMDLDEFVEIYTQSMNRVGAAPEYFFDRQYFNELIETDEYQIELFVCRLEREVIAGGLFSSCGKIVQYHLGGTSSDSLALAPSKLMFDTVRRWAHETGHTSFHLGGGLGGCEDSLFRFKLGFAKNGVRPFKLWKWVVDPVAYNELVRRNCEVIYDCDKAEYSDGFFPAYRNTTFAG